MTVSVLSRSAGKARVAAVGGRAFLFITLLLSLAARRGGAQTSPASAPTSRCPSEIEDVQSCLLQNNLDISSCADCQGAYFDSLTNETTCGELTEAVCGLLDTCSTLCGPCDAEIQLFEACNWGSDCFLSCSSPTNPTAPNPAPAPAPSPVSVPTSPTSTECASEIAAYQSCVEATGDLQACSSCFDFTFPGQPTCTEYASQVCRTEALCPVCGSCQDEDVAVSNCLNNGVCAAFSCSPTPSASTFPSSAPVFSVATEAPVTFPTAAPVAFVATEGPTPYPCPDEYAAFKSCIARGGNGDSCSSCIISSKPNGNGTVTCSVGEEFTCSVMETCPMCGNCESEYKALNICANADECPAFTCPTPVSTSSPVANPSPVSAPLGPSPTDDRCVSELDGLQDCLATAVSSAEASRCEICVNDAFNGLFPTAESRQAPPSCVTVNNNLCAAVFGTCDCGTCGDEYQLYLSCQVDALTTGCELDCGGTNSSQSTSSSNSLKASFGLPALVIGMISAVSSLV